MQLPGSHIQEGGGNGHARGAWGSALLEEGISEEWSSALPTSLFWERRVWQPVAKLCPESQLQTPHLLYGHAESRLRLRMGLNSRRPRMDILMRYCLLGTSLKQGPPLPSLSRNMSLGLQIDMRLLGPTPSLEPGSPLQLLGEPYRRQQLGPDSKQIFKVSYVPWLEVCL